MRPSERPAFKSEAALRLHEPDASYATVTRLPLDQKYTDNGVRAFMRRGYYA